jgi:hydrogenase maturation protease
MKVKTSENNLVIGVGNQFRCDDAVGLHIARWLAAMMLPGVSVVEQSGDGVALMGLWQEATSVFLVDAMQSNGEPGAVYRFDPNLEPLSLRFSHYSTHALGVVEAIEMSRLFGYLPQRLIIYGIEGKCFDPGLGLSAEVEEAANNVARRLLKEIRAPIGCTSFLSSTN